MGYGAPVYACVGVGDAPSGCGDSGGSENGQTGRHTFDSVFTESFAWESSICVIGEIVGDTLCSLTKRTGDTLVRPVPIQL